MSKLHHALAIALLAAAAVLPPGSTANASAVVVGLNRCNGQTVDDVTSRLRDYERHAPGNAQAQLVQRYGALADAISTLGEEREILKSVCATESQTTGLFTHIAAMTAWALVLEADVTARLNASCPAAARGFPTMMLADAWLSLANRVNEENGEVPGAFNDVITKIQTGAQAVGLVLPPWSETSQYWRDQVHAKEKAAIATCPSPSPRPT